MEEVEYNINEEIYDEILEFLNKTFKRSYLELHGIEVCLVNFIFTLVNSDKEQETRFLSREYMTEKTDVMGKIHPSFLLDNLDEAVTVEE